MITFARVLCPVDFSEPSRAALQLALMLARSHGSEVHVPHVVFLALPPVPRPPETAGALTADQQDEVEQHLRTFVDGCEPGDVAVRTSIELGAPVGEIVRLAKGLPADLIVMGTHGRSGFEHLLMGSITERVLRKAPCPVLTIRPDAHARPHAPAPFARILCAVDFSPAAMNALEYAVSLARQSTGHLTLVHGQDWPFDVRTSEIFGADASRYQQQLHDRAARELAAAVPDEARRACTIEERIAIGRPHDVILTIARETAADLIVIGAHARSGLDLHVLGSTADHVVREAACPVLIVRR